MFKLLYFKLDGHPQLGNLELRFVEENEKNNAEKPYTTVIIGANGTGKSFILKTIADVFKQFKDYQESEKKHFKLPFTIHLLYKLDSDHYEIVTRRLKPKGTKKEYRYFKNRPWEIPPAEIGPHAKEQSQFEVSLKNLGFPDNVIVASLILNDRFTFSASRPQDFYQYLGVRRTRSVTSTSTFPRKTVRYLFESSQSKDFRSNLEEMLSFMSFEKYFQVRYKKRYRRIFFTEELTADTFDVFYTKWWTITERKKTNPPYAASRYKALKRNNPAKIESIVKFLKNESSQKSKALEIDLFKDNTQTADLELLDILVSLDILALEVIQIRKKDQQFSIEQSSSGEANLIISLLGLYSKIKPRSLILFDEPEISLHPNWQMRYIYFLKQMYRKFPGCHFILASHSHFIVSDLEGASSAVVSITRDRETNAITANLLEGKNTYGWSAEEVLFNVFNVKSTRNHYIEMAIADLLNLLAVKSEDFTAISKIVSELKKLSLSDDDPLLVLIDEAEEYIRQ